MKTLARNADNDIFMSARGLAIAKDAACRCVVVDSMIATQKGELQLDEDRGVDYFGTVFQNPKYIGIWAAQVKSVVRSNPWVMDIEEFTYSFDRETGALTWDMVVKTTYGDSVSVGSNRRTFTTEKGDGKMGIRWEDIIGKPDNVDEVAESLAELKRSIAAISDLSVANSLGDAKSKINEIKSILESL